MNIVTKQEKETRIKTVKRYFADDGTEFKTEEECARYETDIKLKYLAEKYKLKEYYSVPNFIFSGFTSCSYTLCIPKENNIKELSTLCDVLINNVIDVDEVGNFEVDFERDLRNVRESDTSTEKLLSMKLEESKIYVFYVYHNECSSSYDSFCWELVSEEKARKELQKQVSKFEELFNTNFGYNKAKEEMQAQIEKMKCCENCKHYVPDALTDYCKSCYRFYSDFATEGKVDKWEIKEK